MDQTKQIKKWVLILPLLMIISLFPVSCFNDSDSHSSKVPRFESADCASELGTGDETVCGYLVVPEDRDDPDSGTIKLHVAILKARDAGTSAAATADEPDTGPLVFLTGGPGTSTMSAYYVFENLDTFRNTFGHDRDLIILDQRGTNLSQPALYCSRELADLRTQAYGMTYRQAADLRVATLSGCYGRLLAEGVDLDGYDTNENAADVKALRDALNYDKVNLFGASYGTRLTMTVMKEYPEIIRSVTIDSILPPEVNPFEMQPEGTMYALNTFFKACKDDYPDTESNFYGIIDRLEAAPVNMTGFGSGSTTGYDVEVTAVKFIAYMVSALRSTPYDASLPKTIKDMYDNGTYQSVANSWIGIVNFFFTNGTGGSNDPSVGMFESINASSDGYYTSQDRIFDNIEFYMHDESIREWAQVEFYYWYPSNQGEWPVEAVSPDFQYPVISSIPTLMLVGTLDAGTPPIFSEPSSRYLSNSFYVEILAGHATASLECVAKMLDDFIIDPATEPVSECETKYAWK
ncbi:MAG: alpha/beta hydrolase [Desulfobacteraceae bacterium]|nr:alpha/beta hydrolase [Desulfobacteraceae bacterium]